MARGIAGFGVEADSPAVEAAFGEDNMRVVAEQIGRLPRSDYQEEVAFMESVLERNQTLIRMLDTKVAVISLIACALAATIVFRAAAAQVSMVCRAVDAPALVLLAVCITAAVRAVLPRLSPDADTMRSGTKFGGDSAVSVSFFGHIAQQSSPTEYLRLVTETCDRRVPRACELANQIHAISKIAACKSRLIAVAAVTLQAAVALAVAGWVWQLMLG